MITTATQKVAVSFGQQRLLESLLEDLPDLMALDESLPVYAARGGFESLMLFLSEQPNAQIYSLVLTLFLFFLLLFLLFS